MLFSWLWHFIFRNVWCQTEFLFLCYLFFLSDFYYELSLLKQCFKLSDAHTLFLWYKAVCIFRQEYFCSILRKWIFFLLSLLHVYILGVFPTCLLSFLWVLKILLSLFSICLIWFACFSIQWTILYLHL
jgi:hypothetical protein